jgi:4-hydroxy-3-methylbut-2-enyl diphosphate reductase
MSQLPSPLPPVLLAPLRTEVAAARLGARSTTVIRVGMGPRRAEVARARLARTLPPGTPVGVIGFAGGLSESDRAGDVIVATELRTVGEVRARVGLDESVVSALREALAEAMPGSRVRSGPVLCTPTLLSSSERRAVADGESLACEMESAWLAPLGKDRPFAVVRIIVDLPGRELVSPWTVAGGLVAFRRLVPAARSLACVLGLARDPVPAAAPALAETADL